jgi:NAD(P)-dependent dehydrogenase (short-subunit alcohol dehydrogenase family)
MTDRTWLITGAGRGIGRALTEAALAAGERVIATVRDPSTLAQALADHPDLLHVRVLDVRDRIAVEHGVASGLDRFGRIDVVVNNAGHGLVGAIEEVDETLAREILDTNIFGALWVTRAALPYLRRQGTGHIVQISTVGAVGAMPTMGLYNATKWALEGFSEALAGEVAQFGVRVTIAELGGFGTDWARSSMRFAAPDPAYDPLRETLYGTAEVPWPPVDEPGDTEASPAVAAAAIRAHVDAPGGPLRLLVGDDAPALVAAALTARRDDYLRDPRFTWPAPSDDPAR